MSVLGSAERVKSDMMAAIIVGCFLECVWEVVWAGILMCVE